MRAILDRYEEASAILELEDGSMLTTPKSLLPDSIREGDVMEIELACDQLRFIRTLPDERAARSARIADKFQKLLNKESLK